MVVSSITYSLSGSDAKCLKMRSNTPPLDQRLKRWCVLAEAAGQIAPGDANAVAIDHSLHKEPVVVSRSADVPLSPRQQIPDPLPLVVSQAGAPHDPLPPKADHPLITHAPPGKALN